ncbi:MAG: DoxX family protein [Phycisphaerales bacterium]
MRCRDRAALTLGPLFVRLPLAIVFLWAGLGKLVADIEVGPEQAVVLSAAGVRLPKEAAPEPNPPTLDQPLAEPPPTDTSDQSETPSTKPSPTPPSTSPPAGGATQPTPADDESAAQARRADPTAPRIILVQNQTNPTPTETPAGTPDTTIVDDGTFKVRRVNGLILIMHERSEPGISTKDGSPTPAVWPSFLAQGVWPKILAWAACFTEIFAGFFLLIGLLTRLSALALAGVMGVAMWLTTFGQAIQTDNALLGFIPTYGAWSEEWLNPLLQFTLFMAALALVCMGSGAIALDRAIFAPAPNEEDDWDEGDSLPQSLRDRHAFDRSP